MAKDNVIKFEEKVMNSEELQKKLMDAAKTFDGDRTDEKAIFEAVILPLAKEVGMDFTFEEAAEVKKAGADRELGSGELKSVAGGYMTSRELEELYKLAGLSLFQ